MIPRPLGENRNIARAIRIMTTPAQPTSQIQARVDFVGAGVLGRRLARLVPGRLLMRFSEDLPLPRIWLEVSF
jgi:hypothetical protein